jgi:YD repeat-containing protein
VVYKDETNDVTVTGPDGLSVERLYNPFGQMLQEQVDDAIYGYGYDDNGDMVESTDAEQATTRYAYDAFGRPVKTTYADGTADTIAYNAVDRLIFWSELFRIIQQTCHIRHRIQMSARIHIN